MGLRSSALEARVGTQVHVDLQTLLSGSVAMELRALLERRGVLVIRGLTLNDEQQIAFGRTLGTVMDGAVYKVSVDKRVNPEFAEYNRLGNFSWHMDRTDLDAPNFCSILRPQTLSSRGGETQFANTYAACEDLPESEQTLYAPLKVIHRLESSFRESVPNPTAEQLTEWRRYPPKTHPLVWQHRSGRRSLALSSSATEIVGWSTEAGAALLQRLMSWATQPRYVYTHRWQMGDLLLWDNTGTMHRVLPYDPHSGRCLHRVTLQGEESLSCATVPAQA
jgi:alpha-ketoglutarate-dependent taurine dioxygenase